MTKNNLKTKTSKDGNVTFWPKHMDDKMRVLEILMHIEGWNQDDIDNCDDIIFMGSLEARRDAIEELLKLLNNALDEKSERAFRRLLAEKIKKLNI